MHQLNGDFILSFSPRARERRAAKKYPPPGWEAGLVRPAGLPAVLLVRASNKN